QQRGDRGSGGSEAVLRADPLAAGGRGLRDGRVRRPGGDRRDLRERVGKGEGDGGGVPERVGSEVRGEGRPDRGDGGVQRPGRAAGAVLSGGLDRTPYVARRKASRQGAGKGARLSWPPSSSASRPREVERS